MLAFYCYLGIKLHAVYLLCLCTMSWHNAKIDCDQRKHFFMNYHSIEAGPDTRLSRRTRNSVMYI